MESNFEWITANGDIGIRFFHSIDDGGYSNPPHWHNDMEILCPLSGSYTATCPNGTYVLRPGDLLLFGDMAIYSTCKNNTFTQVIIFY